MKVLIVSDTHGKDENLEKVLEIEKPLDMLIHLGDVEGSEKYIPIIAECPCEMVAGNNDFFSTLPRELEIEIAGYRALLTHGNYYYVSLGPETLITEGVSREKDIVMFGHTHRPYLEQQDDFVILNPGSLSYPRQDGKIPTYIVMEIEEDGNANYEIKELK